MSIQEEFIDDIIQQIRTKKVFVVAGTHFHSYDRARDRSHLACPVLISNGSTVEQYHIQKNTKSHVGELPLEKQYSVTIGEGRGMLRFTNTGFGDIGILICYDFLDEDMSDALSQKVDLLIVPCWNQKSGLKRFGTQVGNAKNKRIFTVYSNNGKFGGSGLYAPYKGKYLREIEASLFKEGEEGVKLYTVNTLELDISRDKGVWNKDRGKLSPDEEQVRNKYEKPAAGENVLPRYKKD